MTTITRFGLRHKPTNKLLNVGATGVEDCSYEAWLSDDVEDLVYLTKDRSNVERVLTDVGWYNSGLNVPQLSNATCQKFSVDDLEIVEVTLTF